MLDGRRARRALDGILSAGEQVEAAATDAISGDLWALTAERLFVLHDGAVSTERALAGLTGEVREVAAGAEVRVRDGSGVLIGSFRARNALVRLLERRLAQPASE